MKNNMIDIHLKNFEARQLKKFTTEQTYFDKNIKFCYYTTDEEFEMDFEEESEPEEFTFQYPQTLLDENASFKGDSNGNLLRMTWEEIEKVEMQFNEVSLINFSYYLYWKHDQPTPKSPNDFVVDDIFYKYYEERLRAFNLLIAYYCTGFYFMDTYENLDWLIETCDKLFIRTKEKCRSLECKIVDYDFYKMKHYGDLFHNNQLIEPELVNEYLKYYLTLYSYMINGRLLYELKDYSRMITEIQNDFFSNGRDQNSNDYIFDLLEIFTDSSKIKANDYLDILVRNGFASESEWFQPHYISRIFYQEMKKRGKMKALPYNLAVKYFDSKYENFSPSSFVKPVDFSVDQAKEYKELIALEINLVK